MQAGAGMALVTGPVLGLCAWLIWYVTRAAADERLHANPAIGIRFPSTLRSDAAWRAAHRAALGPTRWIARSGLVCAVLLTASAALAQGEQPHPVTLGLFGIGYGAIVLGGSVWASVVATRAANDADPTGPHARDR